VSLAVVTMMLGILALTLAGAWVEARWPNAAGSYITATPQEAVDAAGILWQLRRLDGVQDALAVFRADLVLDETLDTGWSSVWLLANQTDAADLAFLPPDPAQKLWQGRLPAAGSTTETVLSYELAQILGLQVADTLRIQDVPFTVVGIWGPSARVPGNWAQVSLVAAEAILSSPDHFVVVPMDAREVTDVARRIWQKMPDLTILSPEWEMARMHRERTLLGAVLGVAVGFFLLLAAPAWSLHHAGHEGSTMLAALVSGAAGLAVGWAATTLANLYLRDTLALTPLRVTPRLAVAVLAAAVLVRLLGALLPFRRFWSLRCAAATFVLTLCAAALVAVGALSESLHLSLSEAQRTAADWVTLTGVEADPQLLRTMEFLPGIRGYAIEASGGLANQDEQRWLGPRPVSGVFYGVSTLGGEGTLTIPYRLSYWRGRPLNPENANEVVVGYDFAQSNELNLGDVVEIRGVPFTVVGIRERLPYDPSSDANYRLDISLHDLRRVLRQPSASGQVTLLIPPAENQEEKSVFLSEMATRLNVAQVLTVDDRLAQIARSYPAAWTLTPASASEAVRHAQVSYGNLVLLCSVFFWVASALSVSGAMRDRLAKDEQRISLLKALGSDEGALLGEYLQMAAVLGVVGALLGILGGWAVTMWLNGLALHDSPQLIFTPRLGAATLFAVAVTSIVAAVAPVVDAVRQSATWSLYPRPTDGGAECQSSPAAQPMAEGTPEVARSQVAQGGSVP